MVQTLLALLSMTPVRRTVDYQDVVLYMRQAEMKLHLYGIQMQRSSWPTGGCGGRLCVRACAEGGRGWASGCSGARGQRAALLLAHRSVWRALVCVRAWAEGGRGWASGCSGGKGASQVAYRCGKGL